MVCIPEAGRGEFILNLALTGAVPTRAHSPHVPLTVDEVHRDVEACMKWGLTSLHVHARDGEGRPSSDPVYYRELVGSLRRRWPSLVICVSCTGRCGGDAAVRGAVLSLDGDARPDMASLTLSSLNFGDCASVNDPATVRDLARAMDERGIRPELEIFDLGMANVLEVMVRREQLRPPHVVNLLLGNVAGAQTDPLHLAALVAALPVGSLWSVAGLGRFQLRANAMGLLHGHGVRTGLEDDLWWDEDRSRLARNDELVERVVAMGRLFGRSPMPSARLRDILGLPGDEARP